MVDAAYAQVSSTSSKPKTVRRERRGTRADVPPGGAHCRRARSNSARGRVSGEIHPLGRSTRRRTVGTVGVLALVPPALHTAHGYIDSHGSTVHTCSESSSTPRLYLGEKTHTTRPRCPVTKLTYRTPKVQPSPRLSARESA